MTRKIDPARPLLSRRHLLTRAVGCIGAAATAGVAMATPAAAWPAPGEKWSDWAQRNVIKKSTQQEAEYQPTHFGLASCANCRNFIGPDQCAIVEGRCNPDGHCSMHYKI